MKSIYSSVKYFLITLLLCILTACQVDPKIQAAYDLIERVTPGYSNQFSLELIDPINGLDVYEIGSDGHKVVLKGNNPVALATAFNQYLKYTCNVHISWLGTNLNLPKQLPLPKTTTKNTINGKYRVYMNYCTLSYSCAWWNWERWQREIDFMAMNSVNMPLSVVGLEAVWYNTLLKYKFTDQEAREFLAAPGHSAWQWMQNLQSFGGPLPKSWIEKHKVLGKQFIDRVVELGMHPIQQGFSGFVPRLLAEKYPNAKIQHQGSWCGFKGAAQLDPTDSLFTQFGRDFLEEEKKLYGAHGVYASDPFHESMPPVNTPEYLSAVGKTIYKLFQDFDPNSIWAMQSWSLREPIVKAVPKDNLLILDLKGEKAQKKNSCWGYPVIAGNLHSWGGRINMHGDLALIASNQYKKAHLNSPNVCGSGLFMEAIEQNPVYYDLAFEMPLHKDEIDVKEWLKHYVERRYGMPSEHTYQAWMNLLEGPYTKGTNGRELSSIIAARPALKVKKSGPNAGLGVPYPPQTVIRAEGLLLEDADKLKHSDSYRYDIVDVQRQLMSNLGQAIHKKAADAFLKRDLKTFKLHSGRFLQLLKDVDCLLRTREELSLDKWITMARSWGETDEEKELYERDATTLVTIWGADGDPVIFDYSWREWPGLISSYYYKRWEMFYSMLEEHLENGTSYSEDGLKLTHGREALRANEFYNKLADWEISFASTVNKKVTPGKVGDEIEVASEMYHKYQSLSQEYYSENEPADCLPEGRLYENLGEK